MLEVAPEMLSNRAGVVFVDGIEETKAEAGELQGYEGEVCEVGSVLGEENEGKEGRERWEKAGGDLTVFKSVSFFVSRFGEDARDCDGGAGEVLRVEEIGEKDEGDGRDERRVENEENPKLRTDPFLSIDFFQVGLAVQDVSITRLVFDKAKELGLGVETEY